MRVNISAGHEEELIKGVEKQEIGIRVEISTLLKS